MQGGRGSGRLHEVAQDVLREAVAGVAPMRHSRHTGAIRRSRAGGDPWRMSSCASFSVDSVSACRGVHDAGHRRRRSASAGEQGGVPLGARLAKAREPAASTEASDADLVAPVLAVVDHRIRQHGDAAPTDATMASHSSCTQLAGNGAAVSTSGG